MFVNIGPWPDSDSIHDERSVEVRIDKFDTFDMCTTLSLIVLPMLKQLKDQKQGAPNVDDEDVPKELMSIYAEEEGDIKNGITDSNWFDRWTWVMDEMIYAFESLVGDNKDWEMKYHSGVIDRIFIPIDKDGNEVPKEDAEWFRWDKTDKDTSDFDLEGYEIESKRIQNGFRLFGKYYQSLWY